MEDMGFLDDDVEWICNRAEAILRRMLGGVSKNSLQNDFDRLVKENEQSLEVGRVVEACIKDAMRGYKKALNVDKRAKEIFAKNIKKSVKPFTTDELIIAGFRGYFLSSNNSVSGLEIVISISSQLYPTTFFVYNSVTLLHLNGNFTRRFPPLEECMLNNFSFA